LDKMGPSERSAPNVELGGRLKGAKKKPRNAGREAQQKPPTRPRETVAGRNSRKGKGFSISGGGTGGPCQRRGKGGGIS